MYFGDLFLRSRPSKGGDGLANLSGEATALIKLLLVDDDIVALLTLGTMLQEYGFAVTSASSVSEALKFISLEAFQVLLSDLHMPGAGDGLTVVSAMRHANPQAVTILLSAFPEMKAATQAILSQADEVLVKPMDIMSLIETIRQRMLIGSRPSPVVESLATILERCVPNIVDLWMVLADKSERLTMIALDRKQRSGHLPMLLADLVNRLQIVRSLASNEVESLAAREHGIVRRGQGYSAAMMVEEARLLQVSIFQTLQANLMSIDFSVLLVGVMTIADEIDSQLSQSIASYAA